MYNERSFCTDFNQWVKEQYKNGVLEGSACLELKIKKKGKRLNFKSDFRDHQLGMLERANKGFVYHKISDFSPGFKPFDSIILNKAKSFVVIMFYEKYKPKEFIMIHIQAFLDFINKTQAKSITEEECKEIGITYQL